MGDWLGGVVVIYNKIFKFLPLGNNILKLFDKVYKKKNEMEIKKKYLPTYMLHTDFNNFSRVF